MTAYTKMCGRFFDTHFEEVFSWIYKSSRRFVSLSPHDAVIITDEQFKLISEELGFPVNEPAEKDSAL